MPPKKTKTEAVAPMMSERMQMKILMEQSSNVPTKPTEVAKSIKPKSTKKKNSSSDIEDNWDDDDDDDETELNLKVKSKPTKSIEQPKTKQPIKRITKNNKGTSSDLNDQDNNDEDEELEFEPIIRKSARSTKSIAVAEALLELDSPEIPTTTATRSSRRSAAAAVVTTEVKTSKEKDAGAKVDTAATVSAKGETKEVIVARALEKIMKKRQQESESEGNESSSMKSNAVTDGQASRAESTPPPPKRVSSEGTLASPNGTQTNSLSSVSNKRLLSVGNVIDTNPARTKTFPAAEQQQSTSASSSAITAIQTSSSGNVSYKKKPSATNQVIPVRSEPSGAWVKQVEQRMEKNEILSAARHASRDHYYDQQHSALTASQQAWGSYLTANDDEVRERCKIGYVFKQSRDDSRSRHQSADKRHAATLDDWVKPSDSSSSRASNNLNYGGESSSSTLHKSKSTSSMPPPTTTLTAKTTSGTSSGKEQQLASSSSVSSSGSSASQSDQHKRSSSGYFNKTYKYDPYSIRRPGDKRPAEEADQNITCQLVAASMVLQDSAIVFNTNKEYAHSYDYNEVMSDSDRHKTFSVQEALSYMGIRSDIPELLDVIKERRDFNTKKLAAQKQAEEAVRRAEELKMRQELEARVREVEARAKQEADAKIKEQRRAKAAALMAQRQIEEERIKKEKQEKQKRELEAKAEEERAKRREAEDRVRRADEERREREKARSVVETQVKSKQQLLQESLRTQAELQRGVTAKLNPNLQNGAVVNGSSSSAATGNVGNKSRFAGSSSSDANRSSSTSQQPPYKAALSSIDAATAKPNTSRGAWNDIPVVPPQKQAVEAKVAESRPSGSAPVVATSSSTNAPADPQRDSRKRDRSADARKEAARVVKEKRSDSRSRDGSRRDYSRGDSRERSRPSHGHPPPRLDAFGREIPPRDSRDGPDSRRRDESYGGAAAVVAAAADYHSYPQHHHQDGYPDSSRRGRDFESEDSKRYRGAGDRGADRDGRYHHSADYGSGHHRR